MSKFLVIGNAIIDVDEISNCLIDSEKYSEGNILIINFKNNSESVEFYIDSRVNQVTIAEILCIVKRIEENTFITWDEVISQVT